MRGLMGRRGFIVSRLAGGLVALLPGAGARAESIPTLGFLHSGSPSPFEAHVAAFRGGLKESGYVEGRNVTIEYRWAGGVEDRLPTLAAGLVRQGVAVITALGGSISVHAATSATAAIPVLFITGTDPRFDGLVDSLNRPGRNATGVYLYTNVVIEKCIEQLRDLVPRAAKIAVLRRTLGPSSSMAERKEREESDHRLTTRADIQVVVVSASGEAEFQSAFASAARLGAGAVIVDNEALFNNRRAELGGLASVHRLPTAYMGREYVVPGGLMTYARIIPMAPSPTCTYVVHLLKCAKP